MIKMTFRRLLLANVLLLGCGLAGSTQAADTGNSNSNSTNQDQLVRQGEYLARLGDCMACHTRSGGADYAGGLAIKSGLGTIYSTNITPDKQSGIGQYTEQQFADAVRKGVRADGSFLYPAMPYPDYSKISDQDIHALYNYFMHGVAPVNSQPPQTRLSFPFSQRWGMRFWNLAFTPDQPFMPVSGASDQVNRGAYIVESLGHCGSCHSPRGFAMNEQGLDSSNSSFLSGGSLNGWDVPSLRGIPRWSPEEISDYLQTGRNDKAGVAGEMTAVVEHSTSHMSDADLQAIAAYLKFLGGNPPLQTYDPQKNQLTTDKLTAATDLTDGEVLYLNNCGACHFANGLGAARAFPQLDQASIVNARDPHGLIQIILQGAQLPATAKAPSMLKMPGFAYRLSDQQVATLATFVRQGWGNTAAAVSADQVKKVRDSLKSQ